MPASRPAGIPGLGVGPAPIAPIAECFQAGSAGPCHRRRDALAGHSANGLPAPPQSGLP